MKPEVREFTKDNPCTKLDIYNCFRGAHSYVPVQVDMAHSQIGKNVPRVMERDGKLIRKNASVGDYYELTLFGRDWLDKGIRSFLKNHPARRAELHYPVEDAPRRVRRVR